MRMKYNRQNEIISLISDSDIETQEDLSEKLREKGYAVTQATISRDIRELKLVKVAGAGGRYKYSLPHKDEAMISPKLRGLLAETVLNVDSAGNIVVVKTCAGMAQGAAAAIDSMGRDGVVGSVAGDDTIIVIMRTPEAASSIISEIREITVSR